MSDRDTPTRLLREQHRSILAVTDVLEEILERAHASGSMDFDGFADCVAFIRLYADALHHGEEEDLLFPALEATGMPRDAGPIAVMLHEHEQGRAYARAMADALPAARGGDELATRRLVHSAHGYVALIRAHILKEDHVLFEIADQTIADPVRRKLCVAYDGVCQRRFDGCTVGDLEHILARLQARYPIA
jgi:hemerythrin-like domain-containing protein